MNNTAKTTVLRIIFILGLLLTIQSHKSSAQGQVSEVVIPDEGIDYAGFPEISVDVIVSDDTRSRVDHARD